MVEQIPAILSALATLVGAIGGAYFVIKSANRPIMAALKENATTLEKVHEQTNSNLATVTAKLDAANNKADMVTELAIETLRRQLAQAEAEIVTLKDSAPHVSTPPTASF